MKIDTRMDVDEYFVKMARLVSLRGACVRRQVGCVLTNNLNHVLATGYNGRARGVDNCLEFPCGGAELDSGMGLEQCEAIHAEANALLQCGDVEEIKTAYCTTAPCIHCVKLLSNTSCNRIVYLDSYPHAVESERLWIKDRPWNHWEKFPVQMEMYKEVPELELNKPDCSHLRSDGTSAWLEHTVKETTKVLLCNECGVTKEVCK